MNNTWQKPHWVALVILLALGALHVMYYVPHITDDAFISLRYAQRFLEGKGLTWNDGERVEGYSDLLWVLLNAGLASIGFTLDYAPMTLGIVCLVLTIPALLWHCNRVGMPPWISLSALAVMLASPSVAVWTTAGLETPMVLLCYSWAIILSYELIDHKNYKTASLVGICLALICWLRPEGVAFTIILACSLFLFSALPLKQRISVLLPLCAFPLAAYLIQLGFRLSYYGEFVSNTVLAKVAFNSLRLKFGLIYVAKTWLSLLPLAIYAILNLTQKLPAALRGTPARFMAMMTCIFLAFSISILIGSGDTFMAFRAFTPLWMIVVLLTAYALYAGLQKAEAKKEWIFFGYVFACFVGLQFYLPDNYSGGELRWVNYAKELGLILKKRYGDLPQRPLVAVHGAGAIPYYSGLPALDVFGLNDANLTKRRNKVATFGDRVMGHELFNAEYILERKPDILAFEVPYNPFCTNADGTIVTHTALHYETECAKIFPYYRPEVIEFSDHSKAILWLRKDSKIVNP